MHLTIVRLLFTHYLILPFPQSLPHSHSHSHSHFSFVHEHFLIISFFSSFHNFSYDHLILSTWAVLAAFHTPIPLSHPHHVHSLLRTCLRSPSFHLHVPAFLAFLQRFYYANVFKGSSIWPDTSHTDSKMLNRGVPTLLQRSRDL